MESYKMLKRESRKKWNAKKQNKTGTKSKGNE